MRLTVRNLAPLALVPLFTQCGPGPAPQTNAVTGPFDSRGNYIEEWADQPDKWYRPPAPGEKPKQKPLFAKKDPPPQPKPQVTEIAIVQPRPEASAPKPKPVVVKPKPKPKPKVVKYTVKRGDNLTRIAGRHGISLSALRRANGISGDLIRPGQVLTIPR